MTIKINENNGFAITNFLANNSITFVGDIPEDAVVKSVKADGVYLEDFVEGDIVYPRTLKDGEWRVIAVLKNVDRTDFFYKVEASMITEFEVEVE